MAVSGDTCSRCTLSIPSVRRGTRPWAASGHRRPPAAGATQCVAAAHRRAAPTGMPATHMVVGLAAGRALVAAVVAVVAGHTHAWAWGAMLPPPPHHLPFRPLPPPSPRAVCGCRRWPPSPTPTPLLVCVWCAPALGARTAMLQPHAHPLIPHTRTAMPHATPAALHHHHEAADGIHIGDGVGGDGGGAGGKAGSTLRSSRAAPHPSTNRALRRLTSEVGRDPVHSTRYGRQR